MMFGKVEPPGVWPKRKRTPKPWPDPPPSTRSQSGEFIVIGSKIMFFQDACLMMGIKYAVDLPPANLSKRDQLEYPYVVRMNPDDWAKLRKNVIF